MCERTVLVLGLFKRHEVNIEDVVYQVVLLRRGKRTRSTAFQGNLESVGPYLSFQI